MQLSFSFCKIVLLKFLFECQIYPQEEMKLRAKIVSHIRSDHWNPPIFYDRLIIEIPHKGFKFIFFEGTETVK